MAWTPGTINLGASFQNNVSEALDARQFVSTAEDLEGIGAAYNGMIVHVGDTKKNYVCIDKDSLLNSVDNGTGLPLVAVWKEVADTTYVDTAISNLVDGADPALDTLKELAEALENDGDFYTTVAGKVTGPGSATNANLATFSGTTGKLIQDGGVAVAGLATAAHTHGGGDLTSAVPVSKGGTGATTQAAALDAITGSGTVGQVMTTDGTNAAWATAAGGVQDTTTLVDQDPIPSGLTDKVILYSASEAVAESRPDFLYRFEEGVNDAVAIDDGRLGVNGAKTNDDNAGYNGAGAGAFGNYGSFLATKHPKVSVGSAGNPAPFYFTSDDGDRGDFEIQFRVKLDSVSSKHHSLMSTDVNPVDVNTTGFYSVVLFASASSGASRVTFEYTLASKLVQAEWKVPSTLGTTDFYHLAISFMEDDRSFDGSNVGGGKLRCYWNGVVLEDANSADAYHIVATAMNGIGKGPGVVTGPALFHLDNNTNNSGAGSNASWGGTMTQFSGTSALNQYETTTVTGTGFGQEGRIRNSGIQGTHHLLVPDPGITTGAFTVEFFFYSGGALGSARQTLLSAGTSGGNADHFYLYFEANYGKFTLKSKNSDQPGTPLGSIEWTHNAVYQAGMHHWAFVKGIESNHECSWQVYIDGVLLTHNGGAGANVTAAPNLTGEDFRFGQRVITGSTNKEPVFDGHIDGIRISKSDTVYSGGTLTVPTVPFTSTVTYANNPLYLGQYLDGSTGVPAPPSLFHFDGGYTASGLNTDPAVPTINAGTGTVTFETSDEAGFGQHLTIQNTQYLTGGNFVTVPDPGWGTGAFTIEAFINPNSSGDLGVWFGIDESGTNAWAIYKQYQNLLLSRPNGSSFYLTSGNAIVSGMAHYAIVGNGSGNYRVYREGIYLGGVSQASYQLTDFTGKDLLIGHHVQASSSWVDNADMNIDALKITLVDLGWGTSTSTPNFTVPTSPLVPTAYDPSARYFEGDMDEFAVYNHRCLHNTSDKFQPPIAPTRKDPLSTPYIVDSEDTSAAILTTSNLGMLLPKSIEGVADGSPWNDKGVVKIAPLTGDLDGPPVQSHIELPEQIAVLPATNDFAKIYSRNPLVNAKALFHFDGDYENAVLNGSGTTNHGQLTGATSFVTYGSNAGGTGGDFGKLASMAGGLNYIAFSDASHIALGVSNFTIEAFLSVADITANNNVLSCALTATVGAGHFVLSVANGNISAAFWDGSTYTLSHAPGDLVNDKLFHVAVVQNGGVQSIYYNGVRVNFIDNGSPFQVGNTSPTPMSWWVGRIGATDGGAANFEGTIDELLITADAKYTSPSFVVPTVPYDLTTTKLFAVDSAGNETQLTP